LQVKTPTSSIPGLPLATLALELIYIGYFADNPLGFWKELISVSFRGILKFELSSIGIFELSASS